MGHTPEEFKRLYEGHFKPNPPKIWFAPHRAYAERMAKDAGLRPSEWRYISQMQSLYGLDPNNLDKTVIINNDLIGSELKARGWIK